jgi:ADP-heptose:LPS heptosyltransferase
VEATNGKHEQPVLLVLRALKLGDLLVAVPALRALRRAYPEYRMLYAAQDWLQDALELVGGYDLLPTHGLDVPIPIEAGKVDIAVNLHGSGPESEARLAAVRPRTVVGHRTPERPGPAWLEEIHERERWTRLLQWHGIEAEPDDFRLLPPAVPSPCPGATVLHVGAAYGSRLWPEDRFAEVARALSADGHRVMFTGSSAEGPRARDVARLAGLPESQVLAGRLRLAEFIAAIAGSRLVVSADTGAAHLASAYSRPSVVLFGPAPAEVWGPPPGPHIVLTDAQVRRGDTFAATPDPALLAVSVEDVMAAVGQLRLI